MAINSEHSNSQQLNHFINESKWNYEEVEDTVSMFFNTLLDDEGMSKDTCLIIDECANPKKGNKSAGTKRQYCGQLGKVENCQVGVFGALCAGSMVNIVKGHLCDDEETTKIQLAHQIIDEVKYLQKIDFGWVTFDAFYGRDLGFQCDLIKASIPFVADVPKTTIIYLEPFQMRVPKKEEGSRGRDPILPKPNKEGCRIDQYIKTLTIKDWNKIAIRNQSDGSKLKAYVHLKKIYIINPHTNRKQELMLLLRKEIDGKDIKFSFCWDMKEKDEYEWAYRQCKRYFIEKSFKEAKQELGMNEYQFRSKQSYQKHMAMIMLAQFYLNVERINGNKKTKILFSVSSLVKIINATDGSIEKVFMNIAKSMKEKLNKGKGLSKKQLYLRI